MTTQYLYGHDVFIYYSVTQSDPGVGNPYKFGEFTKSYFSCLDWWHSVSWILEAEKAQSERSECFPNNTTMSEMQ